MLEDYRAATSIEEVISIVKSAQKGKDTFLWTSEDGVRETYPIADLTVNTKFFQFTFLIDRRALKVIEPMSTYYIKLDYDMSAFKVFIVSVEGNKVTCSLPDKVLSLEKREKKRTKCDNSPDSIITIKIESSLMSDTYQTFDLRISDYSIGGLGLVLREDQMRSFAKISGNIYLTKLKEHTLAEPLRVEPIYFKKVQVRRGGVRKTFYRVGFMFDEDLPANTLSLFKATF